VVNPPPPPPRSSGIARLHTCLLTPRRASRAPTRFGAPTEYFLRVRTLARQYTVARARGQRTGESAEQPRGLTVPRMPQCEYPEYPSVSTPSSPV
jgi:hypothetical protein